MRGMAKFLALEAEHGGLPLSQIYGRYESCPHEFQFIEGEILCLLELAEIIREAGIKPFLRQLNPRHAPISEAIHETDQEEQRAKILQKLSAHFAQV